jgi:uncharacterized protein YacL
VDEGRTSLSKTLGKRVAFGLALGLLIATFISIELAFFAVAVFFVVMAFVLLRNR